LQGDYAQHFFFFAPAMGKLVSGVGITWISGIIRRYIHMRQTLLHCGRAC